MVFWIILLSFVVLAFVVSVLFGWKLSSMILHPNIHLYETVVDKEVERGSFTREWYDSNVKLEEFMLRSPFGYQLHCAIWPRKEDAAFSDGKRRVVVFVHGYTYCLLGGVKYASIFHDLGFDCVFYDHRNHGLSEKAPTTMGAYESRDLAFICGWAREHYGEDTVLGTHGESMGAATVMLHAGMDDRLAFAIEDCGYSDLNDELAYETRHSYHIPAYPVLWIASLLSRLRGGVFFGSVVPKDALQNAARVPMLFVHGDADELVPFSMLAVNYDAKAGKKEKLVFSGAAHAAAYQTDPSRYRKEVTRFLTENGVL